jgi:hypothetical protein
MMIIRDAEGTRGNEEGQLQEILVVVREKGRVENLVAAM